MTRLLAVLSLVWLLSGECVGGEPLFAPDPDHPWNRLHRHLYSRRSPDGKMRYFQGLEPVVLRRSKFLTQGERHREALKRLDQILQFDREPLIEDPLKRAILQRDMWAVFLATADPRLPRQQERRALQQRLAHVMHRIALSEEQLRGLPDNLADAVNSASFPSTFDPDDDQRPFLPNDLAGDDSSWVLVRNRLRSDNLAASRHVRATEGRSAFLLYLRLPGGRQPTLQYLKRLEQTPPNSETPEIPIGTQVALLRRMMLVDREGTLRMTPLSESLQIRVYHRRKAPSMIEWTFDRHLLFAGRGGGMRATPADEVNYFDLGFLGTDPQRHVDPFETEAPLRATPVVMDSCARCHAGPGIYGFQSMFADHFDRPPLAAGTVEDQITPVIDQTYQSYAWGLLQGLWAGDQ